MAQCGCCRPRRIMAAVALVRRVAGSRGRGVAEVGREVTEDDPDGIRNICRCGSYSRSARRSSRRVRRPGGCEARLGRPRTAGQEVRGVSTSWRRVPHRDTNSPRFMRRRPWSPATHRA
ncbi:hypothetical protein ACPCAJ_13880 [Streptomyces griseoincarnatus]